LRDHAEAFGIEQIGARAPPVAQEAGLILRAGLALAPDSTGSQGAGS
jgi:hypothetical protein